MKDCCKFRNYWRIVTAWSASCKYYYTALNYKTRFIGMMNIKISELMSRYGSAFLIGRTNNPTNPFTA